MVAHWKSCPPQSAVRACTVSACSCTLAGLPWNSISSIGASRSPSWLCALTTRTALASSSSQRAIGTPIWIIWIVARTAEFTSGNWQIAALTASGSGCSLSVTSQITPSVPSLPTMSRVRS